MRRLNLDARDERGVVAVIVALLLTVMVGFAAYVIDVGALYQERRELQNGADAAALAVAEDCAKGDCGAYTSTAAGLADANAQDAATSVDGVTIDMAAQTVTVDDSTLDELGGTTVPFSFAPVLGNEGATVHTRAVAQWGVAMSVPAVPLTVSLCEFEESVGDPFNLPEGALPSAEVTIAFHDGNGSEPCNGPAGQDLPGGFGWLDSESCEALSAVDDDGVWVGSEPGVSPPQACTASNFPIGEAVVFPVFDNASGQGQFGQFHVVGYGAFELTGYRLAPGNTWVEGTNPCTGVTTTTTTTTTPGGKPGGGGGGGDGGGSAKDQVCITGRFVEFYEANAQLGGPLIPNFGIQTAQLIA